MLRRILFKISMLVLLIAAAVFVLSHPLIMRDAARAPLAFLEGCGRTLMALESELADFTGDEIDYEADAYDYAEEEQSVEDELYDYEEFCPGYITIYLNDADVHRGSLILINYRHPFRMPDSNELVSLTHAVTDRLQLTHTEHSLHPSLIYPLNSMIDAFYEQTGRRTVAVRSSFRSIEQQEQVLNDRIRLQGRQEALRWVAEPGHSEHHAGLAVDFGVLVGGELRTFTGSGVYSWFANNAHYFGFILRYPANAYEVTRTAHEPWHFRYVGRPHAEIMFRGGYLLEQYIEQLLERTPSNSMILYYDDVTYEIFYTKNRQIDVPVGADITISGNNVGGFIVTIAHRF